MPELDDGFDGYYAERLWQVLPAVYRNADTDKDSSSGPLRELVNRIGSQVAAVRRSIDQLWADQSIETCAGWVIPYIGDLVGTNLVNNLDLAAQRLDVANTIHYRRRKGTLPLLEELAGDVSGWTAKVVEGRQRLARTRHGIDPAVGAAPYSGGGEPASIAPLLQAEGLVGRLTGGRAGGFANLRSAHGAALAGGPFDEGFHTVDLRPGRGTFGHFGIPKLLVYLWRLTSFPVTGGTPVPVAGCEGQYVFDPTGRQVPLFLPYPSPTDPLSERWAPRQEWQVPGPLTGSLNAALFGTESASPPRAAYPDAVPADYAYEVGDGTQVTSVWPELGRFATAGTPSPPPTVRYGYGFPSYIGAGPYDRGLVGDPPTPPGGAPETVVTGGTGLDAALRTAPTRGTVTVGDSLTYAVLADVGSATAPIVSLLVRAGDEMRPVLRPPSAEVTAAPWVLTGGATGGAGAQLVLDGLTLSGCDLVLRGTFDTVRLTACTIDPGTAAPGTPPLESAVDGTPLSPCRIWVEADPEATAPQTGIHQLIVDHCVLGPIRTRFGGSLGTLTVSDSVVQGIPASSGPTYGAADVFDPLLLSQGLLSGVSSTGSASPAYPVAAALLAAMQATGQTVVSNVEQYLAASLEVQVAAWGTGGADDPAPAVLEGLNAVVSGASLFQPGLFANAALSPAEAELAAAGTLDPGSRVTLNRGLIDAAFPVALAVAAVAVAGATVQLERVTVLGRLVSHRLSASDSILADLVVADDTGDGCVRFSAYSQRSSLPRKYESATIAPGAPLFSSTAYGSPGYAQLLETADDLIVPTGMTGTGPDLQPTPPVAANPSILTGAESGSEMGAYSADLNPIKEQGLLVKLSEYMPFGLVPVIVHAT